LSQSVSLSVLDAPDGLDLGGLTVGPPVPPVLVVSAVPLTLHDVLLAPVSGVLVAHEAARGGNKGHWDYLSCDIFQTLSLMFEDKSPAR